MPKLLRSWTCSQCLRRQQRVFHRRLATAATANLVSASPVVSKNNTSYKHDDSVLRRIFDSANFWQEFSESRQSLWRGRNVGLFQNHFLRSPAGFHQFADITLRKCQSLLDRVVAISSIEEYRKIVHYLDRISDLLCRIIDVADFVRSTHPDPAFQQAAALAHSRMFEYMNKLNTTTELYHQLSFALSKRDVTSTWTEEELRVALILKKDFSQSAIHLPKDKRDLFVTVSNRINEEGNTFLDNIQPQDFFIRMDAGRVRGLDPRFVRRHTDVDGKVALPTVGPTVSYVLREANDEATRREMYIASRIAAKRQNKTLQSIMTARGELAKLSGFGSYAEMALKDKMAGSPEAVSKFLDALANDNKQHVMAELRELGTIKNGRSNCPLEPIRAWDREYYRKFAARPHKRPTRTSELLPSFFSLGTVMQGLSRLFTSLYGVRFQPVEPLPGETWSPEVRRLDVLNEHDERIAIVYCDLFAREGKSPNPAHFTVRCSRLITASEIAENSHLDSCHSSDAPTTDPVALANDCMATLPIPSLSSSTVSTNGAYQLPTIALICDFPSPPPGQQSPTLLTPTHLTTLFHEMGHAIHSILGRTTLQNVSGTRCATDFAELPSILMESFATDPSVLALFARHWETEAPLPEEMVRHLQAGVGGGGGPPPPPPRAAGPPPALPGGPGPRPRAAGAPPPPPPPRRPRGRSGHGVANRALRPGPGVPLPSGPCRAVQRLGDGARRLRALPDRARAEADAVGRLLRAPDRVRRELLCVSVRPGHREKGMGGCLRQGAERSRGGQGKGGEVQDRGAGGGRVEGSLEVRGRRARRRKAGTRGK